jgi:hypothetical protein
MPHGAIETPKGAKDRKGREMYSELSSGRLWTYGGLPVVGLASALLFTTAPFVAPAQAACVLAGTGTLECSGDISPGGVDNTGISGDVHIQAGATVVGGTMTTNSGVSMGPSGGLLNDGTITGNVNGVTSQGALVLTNNGTLRGNGAAGVIAQGAISATNNGLIQAQTWGIFAGTSLQLENNGRITAGIATSSKTLDLKNNGTLTGSVAGVDITGTDPGSAKVVNDGTIAVTDLNGKAIRAAGNLEVTNRATITGGISAFGINATNTGTINGQSGAAFLSVGAFNLVNSGTISGTTGAALVTGAATITNNGSMTSSGQSATTIAATDITISNTARITSAGRYSSAIAVTNDASITNSSLISSANDSTTIKVGGNTTIYNNGQITVGNAVDPAAITAAISVAGKASITNDGVISAGNIGPVSGIYAGGDSTVTNKGSIAVAGVGSTAVKGNTNLILTNSGTIVAKGTNSIAFYAGTNATLNNTGSLTADGYGVYSAGNVSASNTNGISGSTAGVYAAKTLNLENSGEITGNIALQSGDVANVTNNGTLRGTGTGSAGVSALNSVSITNNGTISGFTGIQVTSPTTPTTGSTITNNGVITGTGGTAIRLTKAADTLNLTRNSHITGQIAIGGGGDTINLDAGGHRSQVITFDTLQNANINVTNAPGWRTVGNSIVIVDTTTLQMADRGVADVRDAVRNITMGRVTEQVKRGQSNDGFYIQPFGGGRHQSENTTTAAYTHGYAGAIAGVETNAVKDLQVGAFAGGAIGTSRASGSAPDSQQASYGIAGFYGRYSPGMFFVDADLTGGIASGQSRRNIIGNMIANGQETVTGTNRGKFISPEIGVGVNVPIDDVTTITPAVRYRYLVTSWDGMTESDPTAGLNLGSRSSRTGELRAEVSGNHTYRYLDGTLHLYETIGTISRSYSGTQVNAQLLGTSMALDALGPRTTFGVFAAAGLEWRDESNYSFFASLRGEWNNDKTTAISGRAGTMVRF